MKYSGIVYRPPFEANSFLLQATVGCSHNKCSFCTMYRDIPFDTESMEDIEAQLIYASKHYAWCDRVFVENGDAFVLEGEKLIEIARMVKRYLPKVDTISMYASIKNIKQKSDEELEDLRALGVNELNIGVETGLDSALSYLNKGYTKEEAVYHLGRLKKAGMDYGLNIIYGAGGAEAWQENADETADLLNKTDPFLIFTGTIHASKGCPLYDDMKNGVFKESTNGELLSEMKRMIEQLQLSQCIYFGVHPSNIIPMRGMLPRDREEILRVLEDALNTKDEKYLNSVPVHEGEEGNLVD